MVKIRAPLVALLFLLFSLPISQSLTATWNVAYGHWDYSPNWDTGLVPTITDNAVIPEGTTARITSYQQIAQVDNYGTIIVSASNYIQFTVNSVGNSSGTWIVEGIPNNRGTLHFISPASITGTINAVGGHITGQCIWSGAREMNYQQLRIGAGANEFFSVPGGLILRNSELLSLGARLNGLTEIHNSTISLTIGATAPCPAQYLAMATSSFSVTGDLCNGLNYNINDSTLSLSSGSMILEDSIISLRSLNLDHSSLKIYGTSTILDERMFWPGDMGTMYGGSLIFEDISQTLNLGWTSRLQALDSNSFVFRHTTLNLTSPAFPATYGTYNISYEFSKIYYTFPATIPSFGVTSLTSIYTIRNYNELTRGTSAPVTTTYQWNGKNSIYLENSNIAMVHQDSAIQTSNVLPVTLRCVGTCQFSITGTLNASQQTDNIDEWDMDAVMHGSGLQLREDLTWRGAGSLRIDPTPPGAIFVFNLTQSFFTDPTVEIPISGRNLHVRGGGAMTSLSATDSEFTIYSRDGLYGSKLNLTRGRIRGDVDWSLNTLVRFDHIVLTEQLYIEQGSSILASETLDIRGTTIYFDLSKEGWRGNRIPRLDAQTISLSYYSTEFNAPPHTEFVIVLSSEMLNNATNYYSEIFFTTSLDTGTIPVRFQVGSIPRDMGNCLEIKRFPKVAWQTMEYSIIWTSQAFTNCSIYAPVQPPTTPTVVETPRTRVPQKRSSSTLGLTLGIVLPIFLLIFIIPIVVFCIKGHHCKGSGTNKPKSTNLYSTTPTTPEPLIYASEPLKNEVEMEPIAPQPQQSDAQQPYAQQPYAQQPYAQQPYAQQPYAQQPYAQQPYAQQPYAQQPYAQQAPYNSPYGAPTNTAGAYYPPPTYGGAGAGYHS